MCYLVVVNRNPGNHTHTQKKTHTHTQTLYLILNVRKSAFETRGSVACLKQTRTRSVQKADLYETIWKGLNVQVMTSRSLSNHVKSIRPATFHYSNLLFYLLTKFFVQPTFSFKGYMVNVATHTRLSCNKFWLL